MKQAFRLTPIIAALGVAAGLAFSAGAHAQTIKIGVVGPTTGAVTQYGDMVREGVDTAVERINAAGGINGKKLETVVIDDGCEPKQGPVAANRVVNSKIGFVVGHVCSGATIAAADIYNNEGVVMVTPSATSPALTDGKNYEFIFRTIGRDDQQGPAIAAYIATELKARTVALVDDKTAYGEGLAAEVEKALRARGVAIVGRERTTDKETDFKSILTRIKSRNPDAVFHGGMDATGGLLLKQARELGVKAQFAFGDGACTDEMAALAGRAGEGLACSQAGLPAASATRAFRDAFIPRYGETKLYAPFFYDAANVVIEAMRRADSTDPAKFTPEIYKTSLDGATGHIAFDAKGDRRDAEMTIFRMRGGKIVPVAIVKGGALAPFGT